MSLENLSFEARDELASLAQSLAENPSTRKEFLRLTKRHRPELPIPELEIEDYTNKAMQASEQRVQNLEAKLREKDAIETLNKRRQSLVKKGFVDSEDDIQHVEKVMLDKGITNHEAAAEYWQYQKQLATPTPTGYNPSAINKFDLAKYWKNPVAGARDEAAKALNELRKNPRPIGL
jgi:hypothetical protein